MKTKNNSALGIIQTRGFGDIIIALPIAYHYHQQGREIYWPVCEHWCEQLDNMASWVNWVPVPVDTGKFFYDTPVDYLRQLGVTDILPLYQALTSHPEFSDEPYFQHTSFDQYKYIRAGVPFIKKWELASCIHRNLPREEALYKQKVPDPSVPYVVTHLHGSEQTVTYDPRIIPSGWNVVNIDNTGWVADWLGVICRAEAVIMTDSCFANLVDQLQLPVEKYFIPQHHIGLTPVHGTDWIWLPNPELKPQSVIFKGA